MCWVMGKPVVLLGKMEHAENLLQKRMMTYGDRPQLVVAPEFITQNGWYIGTARSKHDTHKKQRKILGERLRAHALKDWAHPAELPEVHALVHRLIQQPERFVSAIKCFTVNTMLRTRFGNISVSDLDDPIIEQINAATDHQFIAQIQGRFWVDYAPFAKYLPAWLPGMEWKRQGLRWRDDVNTFYGGLWNMTKKQTESGRKPSCLVGSLLGSHMHQISEPEGITISTAMVDAGTETLTGTTVVL
jgi:hypothetical protein